MSVLWQSKSLQKLFYATVDNSQTSRKLGKKAIFCHVLFWSNNESVKQNSLRTGSQVARVRKKIAERGLGRETKRWGSLYIDFALMLLINPLAIIILLNIIKREWTKRSNPPYITLFPWKLFLIYSWFCVILRGYFKDATFRWVLAFESDGDHLCGSLAGQSRVF